MKFIKSFYRALNRQFFINGIVRFILRGILRFAVNLHKRTLQFWPVSGVVQVEIAKTSLKLYAKGDDALTSKIYYGLKWEESEFILSKTLFKHTSVFFDVGSNIGVYSLLARKTNNTILVHCFEPNPRNLKRIEKNLQINGFQSTIVTVPKAVSSSSTVLKFTIPKGNRISDVSSFYPSHTSSFNDFGIEEIDVPTITLDQYIEETGVVPDFIKIDVELHELEVLKGAHHLLSSHAPILLIELFNDAIKRKLNPSLHNQFPEGQTGQIQDLIKSYGYHIYLIGKLGLLKVEDLHFSLDSSMYLLSKIDTSESFLRMNEVLEVQSQIKSTSTV